MINQRFGQEVSNLSTVAKLRTFDVILKMKSGVFDIGPYILRVKIQSQPPKGPCHL
jgi:hypothetical protein